MLSPVLVILSVIYGFCGACSSRNALKMRPPHVPRPTVTYRTYPCPQGPAERLCMNGGTCFTLFENATDFFCKCAEGYCGLTCGDKYTRKGCFSTSSLLIMADDRLPRPGGTFPCPPGPDQWLCLNGGTCFTVFENATDYACHCREGFCGLTCGDKYTLYGCFSSYVVFTASVAGGLAVTIVVVLLLVVLIHLRCRRKSLPEPTLKPSCRSLSMPDEDKPNPWKCYEGDGRLCEDYSTAIGLM